VPPAYASERCATARRESASVQSDNPSKATNFDEELTGRRQHREPAGRRFTHAGSGEQEGDGGEEESGGQHAAKDGQSRETWVDRQEHRGRDLNCAEHRRKRIHRENVVEPAHERAVGNQRLDALCLISGELQRADPGDDDDEAVPADNARDRVNRRDRPTDVCSIQVDRHGDSPCWPATPKPCGRWPITPPKEAASSGSVSHWSCPDGASRDVVTICSPLPACTRCANAPVHGRTDRRIAQ
jgi:hypothetical protein